MKIKTRRRIADLNFDEQMSSLTDDELLNVLRQRVDYQEKAVDSAIREALRRGVIQSQEEVDRLFPKTNGRSDSGHFSIFAQLADKTQAESLFSSFTRPLIILGLVPFLFALFRTSQLSIGKIVVLVLGGLIWCAMIFYLKKTYKKVIPLILGVGFAIVYPLGIGLFGIVKTSLEWFFVVVVFLMVIYLLSAIYRIIVYLEDNL